MLHGRGLAAVNHKPHGSALRPRYQFERVLWCGENSDIYVVVQMFGAAVGTRLSDLLNQVHLDALSYAYTIGPTRPDSTRIIYANRGGKPRLLGDEFQ